MANYIDLPVEGGGGGINPPVSGNKALISDATGAIISASSVTSTELGYLSGATSNIQTQINNVSSLPVGFITTNTQAVIPSGYALCNGQPVSRSTYSALFSAIGTTYGSGDGSTTFNLPSIIGPLAPWARTTDLPNARDQAPLVPLADGRILYIAGGDTAGTSHTETYIGNFNNDLTITWTSSTALPAARRFHCATTLSDGRVFVAGGFNSTAKSETWFGTVSGNTITWASGTALTSARYGSSVTQLSDGRLLILGGNSGAATITTTEFGTISTNTITWVSGTALPAAIASFGFAKFPDDKMIIVGGSTGGGVTNVTRILSVSSNTITYTAGTNASGNIENQSSCTLNDGRALIINGTDGTTVSTNGFTLQPALNGASYITSFQGQQAFPVQQVNAGLCVTTQGHLVCAGGQDNGASAVANVYISYNEPKIIKVS